MSTPLLQVESLSQRYALPRSAGWRQATVQALASVSFTLQAGRNLGVVGESGSGKSTLRVWSAHWRRPTAAACALRGKTCTASRPRPCGPRGAAFRWCFKTRLAR